MSLDQFGQEKDACTMLQKQWRGSSARSDMAHARSAAVVLQSARRGAACRGQFRSLVGSACLVQRWWRDELDMQWKRDQLVLENERREALEEASATMIQSRYRSKKAQHRFGREKDACTTVQKQWRGKCARSSMGKARSAALDKCENDESTRRRWFSPFLNSFFRNPSHNTAKQLTSPQLGSCIRIQRWWRDVYKHKNLKVKRALDIIYLLSLESPKSDHFDSRNLPLLPSAKEKDFVGMQDNPNRALQAQNAKVVTDENPAKTLKDLNDLWAGRDHERQKIACTKIQRQWKLTSSKALSESTTETMNMLQPERERSTSEHFLNTRSIFEGNEAPEGKYGLKETSTTSIQSQHRSRLEEDQSVREKEACKTVQKQWRGSSARSDMIRARSAAVVMQSAHRRASCRGQFCSLVGSASRVQSWWKLNRKTEKSTTVTHCLYEPSRGPNMSDHFWNTRNIFEQNQTSTLMDDKNYGVSLRRSDITSDEAASDAIATSSVSVQRWWRDELNEQNTRDQLALENARRLALEEASATSIQAQFRGRIAIGQFGQEKDACTTLQKQWRGMSARSRMTQARSAAVVLQSAHRGASCRGQFHSVVVSVFCVQSWWRNEKDKQYKRHQLLLENERLQALDEASATIIQSQFRGKMAQNRFGQEIEQHKQYQIALENERRLDLEEASATTIQSQFRGKVEQDRFGQEKDACTKLQKQWRGASVRSGMAQARSAAVVMQSAHRGASCRKQFHPLVGSASLVQSWWRNELDKKNKRDQLVLENERRLVLEETSATSIQSQVRGKIAKDRFGQEKEACATIQKQWRGTSMRSDLVQALSAEAVTPPVQLEIAANPRELALEPSNGRHSSSSSRKVEFMYNRPISIVSDWRRACALQFVAKGECEHHTFAVRSEKACAIQSAWRVKSACNIRQKFVSAAILIQSQWRVRKAVSLLTTFRLCEFSSKRLSTIASKKLAEASARHIQRQWRRSHTKSELEHQTAACIVAEKFGPTVVTIPSEENVVPFNNESDIQKSRCTSELVRHAQFFPEESIASEPHTHRSIDGAKATSVKAKVEWFQTLCSSTTTTLTPSKNAMTPARAMSKERNAVDHDGTSPVAAGLQIYDPTVSPTESSLRQVESNTATLLLDREPSEKHAERCELFGLGSEREADIDHCTVVERTSYTRREESESMNSPEEYGTKRFEFSDWNLPKFPSGVQDDVDRNQPKEATPEIQNVSNFPEFMHCETAGAEAWLNSGESADSNTPLMRPEFTLSSESDKLYESNNEDDEVAGRAAEFVPQIAQVESIEVTRVDTTDALEAIPLDNADSCSNEADRAVDSDLSFRSEEISESSGSAHEVQPAKQVPLYLGYQMKEMTEIFPSTETRTNESRDQDARVRRNNVNVVRRSENREGADGRVHFEQDTWSSACLDVNFCCGDLV